MKIVGLKNLFDKSFLYSSVSAKDVDTLLNDISLLKMLKEKLSKGEQNEFLQNKVNRVSQKELAIWYNFLTELKIHLIKNAIDSEERCKIKYKDHPERFLLNQVHSVIINLQNGTIEVTIKNPEIQNGSKKERN